MDVEGEVLALSNGLLCTASSCLDRWLHGCRDGTQLAVNIEVVYLHVCLLYGRW
jgi:hypothetical protein